MAATVKRHARADPAKRQLVDGRMFSTYCPQGYPHVSRCRIVERPLPHVTTKSQSPTQHRILSTADTNTCTRSNGALLSNRLRTPLRPSICTRRQKRPNSLETSTSRGTPQQRLQPQMKRTSAIATASRAPSSPARSTDALRAMNINAQQRLLRHESHVRFHVRNTCESNASKRQVGKVDGPGAQWSFTVAGRLEWWSRGELNPRPQAILRQIYMLSSLI